jgi:hypothetical protein
LEFAFEVKILLKRRLSKINLIHNFIKIADRANDSSTDEVMLDALLQGKEYSATTTIERHLLLREVSFICSMKADLMINFKWLMVKACA